jgi:hypothetical protein
MESRYCFDSSDTGRYLVPLMEILVTLCRGTTCDLAWKKGNKLGTFASELGVDQTTLESDGASRDVAGAHVKFCMGKPRECLSLCMTGKKPPIAAIEIDATPQGGITASSVSDVLELCEDLALR